MIKKISKKKRESVTHCLGEDKGKEAGKGDGEGARGTQKDGDANCSFKYLEFGRRVKCSRSFILKLLCANKLLEGCC